MAGVEAEEPGVLAPGDTEEPVYKRAVEINIAEMNFMVK
jgi:hypothetical protein